MSISQEAKSKVKTDWLQAFPELAAYSRTCFYKIAGPIVFGIQIINSPYTGNNYRPYFSIYPLWEKNATSCMERPFLYFGIHNAKNLTFDIEYDKHDVCFQEAVYCTRNYIQMPFEGNIPLKSIYEVIKHNAFTYDAHGIIQAHLLKLHLLFYLKQQKEIEQLLQEIEINKGKLLSSYFEHFFGHFDIWFLNLKESLSSRDEFMKKIEINKQDKKLKKLMVSEIVV